MTASGRPWRQTFAAAQRSAAVDPAEPSMPTTIGRSAAGPAPPGSAVLDVVVDLVMT
jgi:hypothetical protein